MWDEFFKKCNSNCNYIFTTTTKYRIQLKYLNPNCLGMILYGKIKDRWFFIFRFSTFENMRWFIFLATMIHIWFKDVTVWAYFKCLLKIMAGHQRRFKAFWTAGYKSLLEVWKHPVFFTVGKNYNQFIQEF